MRAAAAAYKKLVMAPACIWQVPDLQPLRTGIAVKDQEREKAHFVQAKKTVIDDLRQISAGKEVFAGHLELVSDPVLQEHVFIKIEENKNVQLALHETIAELESVFENMENVYFRERADDIRDIGRRLMAVLKDSRLPEPEQLTDEIILVARDLLPSEVVKLDARYVKGILMEEGGATSHAVILAGMKNIPVLTGVKGLLKNVKDKMLLCMDTEQGLVIAEPDSREKEAFAQKKAAFERQKKVLENLRDRKLVTKEGNPIRLCVNAGSIEEIRRALKKNIDGVGLFRTEFLYLDKDHFPTEEEQFLVYKEAAQLTKELTIRTLDIGGDKNLPYCALEKEANPFLGWRGIRISLEWREIFAGQLRAILRAGYYGKVRLLLPMIISAEEIRKVKELLESCKTELRERKLPFDEHLEVGMLMETPASVLLAETFAKEADFFSIGTNDLTQYLLAVDRGNKKVAGLYNSFHPAVLEAIRHIISTAKKAGIRVSMCGEMAGDKNAVPMLLEMGLEEFSMASLLLDDVREAILKK